jgi:hypothetical protein
MMLLKTPSNLFTSQAGRLSLEVVSPRLLTTTMSGRLDVPLARHFLACLDAWVKPSASGLLAFHDWERLEDYDSQARDLLMPWAKAHRPKFEAVHMLVRNRAIAWGIQIANHLTDGNMTTHHQRESFEEARRAAPAR